MNTRSIARAVERLRTAHPTLRIIVALTGMTVMVVLLFFLLTFSVGVQLRGYDIASFAPPDEASSVTNVGKAPTPGSVLREAVAPITRFGEFSVGALFIYIFETGYRIKEFFVG